MTAKAIVQLAREMLRRNGLDISGWVFRFNRRTVHLALCTPKKTIELSQYLIGFPHRIIKELLLHEIAHALVGIAEGHGLRWKQKCVDLGIEPKVTYRIDMIFPPKYSSSCKICYSRYTRQGKPREGILYFCSRCESKSPLEWKNVCS